MNQTASTMSNTNLSQNLATIYLNFFFQHIYLLLLVIVGLIGNTFVILLFAQRALRTSSRSIGSNMSVYPFLFYMAISDNLYLLILFCLWLTNYVNILHRPVICQLTLYISYICNFINAYYTVSFTAQRLFAVVKPFRVSYVFSWHRSRTLALIIIGIGCLIYSYIPFLIGIVDGKCYSYERTRWINRIMDIIDCVIVFLLPYSMIITMNIFILSSIRHGQNQDHQILFQHSLHLNKIREITRRHASRKMTQLLLTVSSLYLIVCAPYATVHTWRLLSSSKNLFLLKLESYFHLIYHISFAMNFYLYILFGSKFRREFQRFIEKFRPERRHLRPMLSTEPNSTSPTMTSSAFIFTYR